MTAATTERPYLFIGGPWNEEWHLIAPGQQVFLIPNTTKAGYISSRPPTKTVDVHWEHKRYDKAYMELGPGIRFPIFRWADWDDDDIAVAWGTYVQFILNCEGGVDASQA